jgi:GH35 family endo-1,4-beta-xylanase
MGDQAFATACLARIWRQGKRFKDSGVPIYGLGFQCHLKSSSQNMDVLKVCKYSIA